MFLGLREELWKLKCRRNARWPLEPKPQAPASYKPRHALAELAATDAPPLCVVITTYGRPAECTSLLDSLHEALRIAEQERAFVLVLRDAASEHDYTPVRKRLEQGFAGRFALHESAPRLGKRGFWFAYQHAFDAIAALRAPLAIFLQDDVRIEPSAIRDALAAWSRIDDPQKAALYLMRAPDDEPNGRWIDFARTPAAQGVSKTQWLDLQAFLAGPAFFQTLSWEVFPAASSRWQRDPARSSGVGEQFTRRLLGRASIYQVDATLALHGEAESLMNPEARALRPLKNG